MTSAIDPSKPTAGVAYTADIRANFQTAANEISALKDTAKVWVRNMYYCPLLDCLLI